MHVLIVCEPGRRDDAAAEAAAREAVRDGAWVTFVAVVDEPPRWRGCLAREPWQTLLLDEARERVQRLAERLGPDVPDAPTWAVLFAGDDLPGAIGRLQGDRLVLPDRPCWLLRRDRYAVLRASQSTPSFAPVRSQPGGRDSAHDYHQLLHPLRRARPRPARRAPPARRPADRDR